MEIARHLEGVEKEWHRLGSVWASQISNARQQMDHAITHLTDEFSGIVTGLDALVTLARELEANESRLLQAVHATGPRVGGDSAEDVTEIAAAELETSAVRLEREALSIRNNVDSSLVHLQFQDRVNQILGHVESNIHALPDALADIRETFIRSGRLTPLDFTPLLAAIEASYTTTEERGLHQNGKLADDDSDDLTFF